MYLSVADILLLTSILQSLVLAGFLLMPDNIHLLSNRLLLATVLAFAAGLAEVFLYSTGLAQRFLNLAYLGTLVGLLQAGLLFLYAKSLMYQDFRLTPGHWIHTLLFWIVGAIFLVEYYLQPDELKRLILMERDHPGVLTSPLLAAAIHLVFLGYLIATIREITVFGTDLRQIFSNIENKQLAWLRVLLLGYTVVWSVSLVYCLSAHVFKSSASVWWVSTVGGVTGFLFINYLLLHALRQPIVFSGLSAEESRLLTSSKDTTTDQPANAVLLMRLEDHMRRTAPHLDANLTVQQLARQLNVPTRELSRAINQGRGKNFFEFVSDYRVAEARRRLTADTHQTILQVMYDSGFNSKSVFNTAFKRATGMTPREYRARQLAADGE
ncbi:AraC family transcriptional regulator [Halomonas sp. MCCC 1A17488]|uniref:AraC family transcriptional regulator n=1 Tax=unclassified Halomonas TaxID=2609666 RepID=UPI0018D2273B|nr:MULTISPECIES: helix-turn-helix domain-containing protein [unclassified Halomonas]MCE8017053.1 AraC family transcriptional regulator [Halomonas sp. MCCC 1A17488]MCG3240386.1 AraC family transcriptional regulator [Halomonas sp. MCCC 1A17488]QPP49750.1 AraC family transcriptional regulator [Halomonas sp. SS10-MC5]